MRVATVDGLVTLFYDGSRELFNEELDEEWMQKAGDNGYDCETWEEWNLSNECKVYWRERETWQQVIVVDGVTEIPAWTFQRCKNIKRVIFSNTVVRIKQWAFSFCSSLFFIKLSINIEVIELGAFCNCNLTSVFIPPRCREIETAAFANNYDLTLFHVYPHTQLGMNLLSETKLMKDSPFKLNRLGDHRNTKEVNNFNWMKKINNDEKYSLHRVCSSYQPIKQDIHVIIQQEGLRAFAIKNKMGITPSRYLKENPFANVIEKDIIQDYIMKLMGELE
ncbi:hypothetical protein CTEN210_02866 [Chaetoceros tenuissimus]|uniref:Leucine-rich repeat domain-containing protein n=1 Tax=Chaetoceros tenuissimus TaxID=426638 RepID=A0AAD3CHU2_9STRA|nr:hypothetical protein CTEN210_02866 [Chaetoceros tenuissimus]